ncbi:MAG: DUF3343 domain-containing protein [Oscillospiraceae bacterium]|jgi:hypothetical protein|nr:DUF3343 domain-containing protein [Oscillospiraceae bacterium]
MKYVYFIYGSITSAQRASQLLGTIGIASGVSRAPKEMSIDGCAHVARAAETRLTEAIGLLRQQRLPPKSVVTGNGDGRYVRLEV